MKRQKITAMAMATMMIMTNVTPVLADTLGTTNLLDSDSKNDDSEESTNSADSEESTGSASTKETVTETVTDENDKNITIKGDVVVENNRGVEVTHGGR